MELRAATQALQHSQAAVLVLALRPQLDGTADRAGGVVVGVHLAEPLRRGQQARTRTLALAAGQPLLSNASGAAPRRSSAGGSCAAGSMQCRRRRPHG